MKKNKISRYLVFISIFTTITIFIFIVEKSYSVLIKPLNQTDNKNLIKPIDPNLDLDTVNQIEQRFEYNAVIPTP